MICWCCGAERDFEGACPENCCDVDCSGCRKSDEFCCECAEGLFDAQESTTDSPKG